MPMFEVNSYLEQYVNAANYLQKGRQKPSGTMMWLYREAASPTAEWKLFAASDQLALERNHSMGVTMMPLEVEGEVCEIDFKAMTRRVIGTGVMATIDRRAFTDQGELR